MGKSLQVGVTNTQLKDSESISVADTKGDVFGVGSSGSGNIFGKEVGYTVQGNVFNIQVTSALSSKEVKEDLREIISFQTQLPSTVTSKDQNKKDVPAIVENKETQQKISNVLDDVKKIGEKEGTQIQEIKAGDFQISTKDLYVKDALARGNELSIKVNTITLYNGSIRQ